MAETTQRWQVGAITLTTVVELQTDGIPAPFFFPDATAGTHFPTHPVGRACAHAGGWRFEAEPGSAV